MAILTSVLFMSYVIAAVFSTNTEQVDSSLIGQEDLYAEVFQLTTYSDTSLGRSLIENNNEDSCALGCSLVDNVYGAMDRDAMGCSIDIDTSKAESVFSLMEDDDLSDIESSNGDRLPLTSTPRKVAPDFVDVEQYSNVLATPRPVPFNTIYLSENSPRDSVMLKKSLNDIYILEQLQKTCYCKNRCSENIGFKTAKQFRYRYWTKSIEHRKQWLMHVLSLGERKGRFLYVQMDNGQMACLKSFLNIYNINKNSVLQCRKLIERGSMASKGHKWKGESTAFIEAVQWMETYSSTFGDRMPNSIKVLLPYKTLKKHVYLNYKQDIEKNNVKKISRSSFQTMWKTHFPNLRIKKINSFSKCTKCASLERKLEKALCPSRRQDLKLLRERHNQRQMLERKYYYSKRQASRNDPKKYLSLIIDGMDQSKSSLPHFIGRRAKVINPADLMKSHITGVIDHGHNTFHTYVDILQYMHDPNLTVNIILKTLLKIAAKKNKLPPVLFLQADNCWRENKNKVVLGFCELLVKKNIFKEVHLSFLYVGHTHEDIDAAFSKISAKLRINDAETLPDLMKYVKNSEYLTNMLDIKHWIADSLSTVSKHTQPLHYKFISNGIKTSVLYKGQQHMPWKVLGGIGSFLKQLPTGKPRRLKANFEHIEKDKIIKQVHAANHMFTRQEKVEWWLKYLNNLEDTHKDQPLFKWITLLPKQPRMAWPVIQQTATVDAVLADSPELRTLLNKETFIPEVICQKRKTLKQSRSNRNILPQSRSRPTGNILPQSRSRPTGNILPQSRSRPTGNIQPQSRSRPTGNILPQSRSRPTGNIQPQSRSRPTGNILPQSRSRSTGNILPQSRSRPTGNTRTGR